MTDVCESYVLDNREVVEELIEEYVAAESPDYITWGDYEASNLGTVAESARSAP